MRVNERHDETMMNTFIEVSFQFRKILNYTTDKFDKVED
jgi:hypothetical protein